MRSKSQPWISIDIVEYIRGSRASEMGLATLSTITFTLENAQLLFMSPTSSLSAPQLLKENLQLFSFLWCIFVNIFSPRGTEGIQVNFIGVDVTTFPRCLILKWQIKQKTWSVRHGSTRISRTGWPKITGGISKVPGSSGTDSKEAGKQKRKTNNSACKIKSVPYLKASMNMDFTGFPPLSTYFHSRAMI